MNLPTTSLIQADSGERCVDRCCNKALTYLCKFDFWIPYGFRHFLAYKAIDGQVTETKTDHRSERSYKEQNRRNIGRKREKATGGHCQTAVCTVGTAVGQSGTRGDCRRFCQRLFSREIRCVHETKSTHYFLQG